MPVSPDMPSKPALEGLESKWAARWEAEATYRFDRSASRQRVFSIDTPPPTVSGSLHVGHVFSFTHTDVIARYQRMSGRAVFYPMGWDDNGLPTERRVQNYFGVRCDPSLPYESGLLAKARAAKVEDGGKAPAAPAIVSVSRPNFIELCSELTREDEKAFERLWRTLGLSVDWSLTYATIGRDAQRVSQIAFLRLLAKPLGRPFLDARNVAFQLEAPTLWDVDFKTAVAQAELEDREMPGAYHRIRFATEEGGAVEVDTTRPELIPACVALVVHPDDPRYRPLVGRQVLTPLFKVAVPVKAHALADPEKGTGVAMICTFGDVTDVTWWRELALPVRAIIQSNGTLAPVRWGSAGWPAQDASTAQAHYDSLVGLSTTKARAKIVEGLRAAGDLVGDPRPITHHVKFFEKGDRPLEIITSRQWFIRTMDIRDRLIERGREIEWHPAYMRSRFENWVNGLNGDWCISRQRFFGVPFPVWYGLRADGSIDHDRVLVPTEDRLPLDPSTDVPPGFTEAERGQPNGFVGDPDVMDTWATSSLTPLLVCGWERDPELWDLVFGNRTRPAAERGMSMRPQAHDIIRTWLFSSVLRAHLEEDTIPWKHAAISGWVLDPDRKKMSKSKGNVVTPLGLLDEHGSDAVRYWASKGGPGVDTAFDAGQMQVGRRLAIKLLNASRFVLTKTEPIGPVTAALDRGMLSRLATVISRATAALDAFDYASALRETEAFFWWFCDDYIELVKRRRAGDDQGAASANQAAQVALRAMLRLFAPFLPFVTEEVWSWWQPGSVHRALWPSDHECHQHLPEDWALALAAATVAAGGDVPDLGNLGAATTEASAITAVVRHERSVLNKGFRVPLRAVLTLPASFEPNWSEIERDVLDGNNIVSVEVLFGETLAVRVEPVETAADPRA
jgi:valyl-tRNA synthetase